MTEHLGQRTRDLLAAPLQVEHGVERLGRALWLYVHLISITNSSGHICRTLDSLAQDLGVSEQQGQAWISKLVDAQLVEVQSPAPYLVMKLCFWSSDTQKARESGGSADARVRGSSKPLQAAAAENINSKHASSGEDGGVGEGEDLLADVLTVLNPADPAMVRELIAGYPQVLVRHALRRVEITPAEKIRKSRFALFRYLLATLPHDHAPTPSRHP